jgi:predicted nucleic acid-binding protein
MAADPVFIDTNVLVAASVSAHPSHGVASAYLARLEADGAPACISGQVCREFLIVLTRQPVAGRVFTADEALAALETTMSVSPRRESVPPPSQLSAMPDASRRPASRVRALAPARAVHDPDLLQDDDTSSRERATGGGSRARSGPNRGLRWRSSRRSKASSKSFATRATLTASSRQRP